MPPPVTTTVTELPESRVRVQAEVPSEEVEKRVAEIAGSVQQISAESTRAEGGIAEVAAVAEQSSASAEQVSASTQETSASTQEIASSAAELARTAEQLDQLVRRFKLTA